MQRIRPRKFIVNGRNPDQPDSSEEQKFLSKSMENLNKVPSNPYLNKLKEMNEKALSITKNLQQSQ